MDTEPAQIIHDDFRDAIYETELPVVLDVLLRDLNSFYEIIELYLRLP
jgi:hypothetical protein